MTVVETSQEAIDTGLAEIGKTYDAMVQRGRIDAAEKDARMARITGAVGFDALADADLVIEAAFEDLNVKKEIFAKLDGVAKPGAVLATNTSYMDIDAIAAATSRPRGCDRAALFRAGQRHAPAGSGASGEGRTRCDRHRHGVGEETGKVGVLARVCHGFIANRSRLPLVREATFLVEEEPPRPGSTRC